MKQSKGKLIIVDAPQGVGKTTLTNSLREIIPSTNLLRLSGVKDMSVTGKRKVYKLRKSELKMIKQAKGNVNFVLDRSFISEYVFSFMGMKPYSFKSEFIKLTRLLSSLSSHYDICVVTLTASAKDYATRLHRDKAEYLDFSVASSLRQQEVYKEVMSYMTKHHIMTLSVNTTFQDPKEVLEEIKFWVNLP